VVDIEQRYWHGGVTSLFIGMVGMLPYFLKHGGLGLESLYAIRNVRGA
jgi:hypothetical protein